MQRENPKDKNDKTKPNKCKLSQQTPGFSFILANYSQVWIISWSMVDHLMSFNWRNRFFPMSAGINCK